MLPRCGDGLEVSIPERVWGGLEPMPLVWMWLGLNVSIPERVWGGLEQRCNKRHKRLVVVSIPERVWGGLELEMLKAKLFELQFQSLRGFGVGWSWEVIGGAPPEGSFNP